MATGPYKRNVLERFPELISIGFPKGQFDKGAGELQVREDWEDIFFQKVLLSSAGDVSLRYGDNPGQPAALYRPVNDQLVIGDTRFVSTGEFFGGLNLLKAGKKSPGKINITDTNSALNILRHFSGNPACVIIKHDNPSGAAIATDLAGAYQNAFCCDVVAAYGGVVAFNRPLDKETAEAMSNMFYEVIVAPGFEEGSIGILEKSKKLRDARIIEIKAMERLREYVERPYLDFTSLMDGSIILQQSYVSGIRSVEDLKPAETTHPKKGYIQIDKEPTDREYNDMMFAWHVLEGVVSNSSLIAKNGKTIAIVGGGQDRVWTIKEAVRKAYIKLANYLSHATQDKLLDELGTDERSDIEKLVESEKAGLEGSVLATDGFMPNRDNILAISGTGISAVIQPGGSDFDYSVIKEANKHNIAMVFTGRRCFRH